MNILLCSPKCTVDAAPAHPDYTGVCVCTGTHTHIQVYLAPGATVSTCACVSRMCVCGTQGVLV